MIKLQKFRTQFATFMLAVALAVSTITPATACICDEICHSGEVYSDEAEMCIPKEQATS